MVELCLETLGGGFIMWMVGGSILGSSNLRGEKSTLSPQTEHHVMN